MRISLKNIEVKLPGQDKLLFHLRQFDIESGQKVLIEGESGRGKTTLLHLIAGLFHPEAGEVRLGEHSLNSMSDEQRCHFRRQNVGIIFQKLNLIEHLTALENVRLASSEAGKGEAALSAVGLGEKIHQRSSLLSLGEQQRVAVARVLAADAKIILADEPTSSLDEKNAANVIDLLFAAAENKTLLVVSHDHRIEKKFSTVIQFENVAQR